MSFLIDLQTYLNTPNTKLQYFFFFVSTLNKEIKIIFTFESYSFHTIYFDIKKRLNYNVTNIHNN